MNLKELIKEKYEEGKEKFKETKAYKFYCDHEDTIKKVSLVGGILAVISVNGAKQYAKGVRKGYHEGIRDNALQQRDRNVFNSTLNYIENAGEDGATFHDRANDRSVTFKKVSEAKDI